jgi:hypothetical protein
MSETLGWHSPYYVKANVTQRRPRGEPLAPDAEAWLEEHNQLDRELYAYAAQLFAQQVGARGEKFPQRVEGFRRRNKTLGRVFDGISRAKRKMSGVQLSGA